MESGDLRKNGDSRHNPTGDFEGALNTTRFPMKPLKLAIPSFCPKFVCVVVRRKKPNPAFSLLMAANFFDKLHKINTKGLEHFSIQNKKNSRDAEKKKGKNN